MGDSDATTPTVPAQLMDTSPDVPYDGERLGPRTHIIVLNRDADQARIPASEGTSSGWQPPTGTAQPVRPSASSPELIDGDFAGFTEEMTTESEFDITEELRKVLEDAEMSANDS